ncbi:MAG TPA: Ku protein [Polyangiaceae bacterium]|jgi:DNA end-binding protein Ku
MPRSIWKGSISFGLVQIPVDLHGAEESDEISFRQLDKHDFAPIGYDRVNKRTGKKVAWEDIVRGYEWDRDEYIVLTDEELESANVEATHTIDIVAFVDLNEVDPMYFEKPYYVTPSKQGQKAYALLRDTLSKAGQIGIAKIVIRTRQHVVALMPRGEALVLVTLRYSYELRKPDDLDLPKKSSDKLGVTQGEKKMAEMLVDSMHAHFDPDAYKDEFRDDILALVEKKAKAGEINQVPEAHEHHRAAKPKANVVDLMGLLKKSLGDKGVPKPSVAKARKRHTHKKAS